MAHYEIEIKSLLGTPERAAEVKNAMAALDTNLTLTSENTQLNHYFEGGDIHTLKSAVTHLFTGETLARLEKIVNIGQNFSVRTRQRDEEVLLVLKASVDAGTSENTVSRLEFEEPVDLSLQALDELVLSAGYTYQAKWSRVREEYAYKGINVCFDKNAGYGYLAEFEKILDDESELAAARQELDQLMTELGVEELPQERLARMFAHYNANWPEYYGTDKIFTIE
jgi:predicted adenylyl cyclase CyaB